MAEPRHWESTAPTLTSKVSTPTINDSSRLGSWRTGGDVNNILISAKAFWASRVQQKGPGVFRVRVVRGAATELHKAPEEVGKPQDMLDQPEEGRAGPVHNGSDLGWNHVEGALGHHKAQKGYRRDMEDRLFQLNIQAVLQQ